MQTTQFEKPQSNATPEKFEIQLLFRRGSVVTPLTPCIHSPLTPIP